MTSTLTGIDLVPPTRSISCCCKTRNNRTWAAGGSAPASSRKKVPVCAMKRELDTANLETVRSFAGIATGYAAGVKKLLNYGIKQFADFL